MRGVKQGIGFKPLPCLTNKNASVFIEFKYNTNNEQQEMRKSGWDLRISFCILFGGKRK